MDPHLSAARRAIGRASETTDDREAREKLRSLVEGLDVLTEAAGPGPRGDRLEEVEVALARLADETGGETRERIRDARDSIDAYRREHTIE